MFTSYSYTKKDREEAGYDSDNATEKILGRGHAIRGDQPPFEGCVTPRAVDGSSCRFKLVSSISYIFICRQCSAYSEFVFRSRWISSATVWRASKPSYIKSRNDELGVNLIKC